MRVGLGYDVHKLVENRKLKNAKQYLKDFFYIKDDVTCFEESDIMLAARFLKDYAQSKKKPLVIYIGAGSGSG